MFGIFKRKKQITIKKLEEQFYRGNDFIEKVFEKSLNIEKWKINHDEITYFNLCFLSYFFIQVSKNPEKNKLVDQLSLSVLNKNIFDFKNPELKSQIVSLYQKRYKEYSSFTKPLLENKQNDSVTFMLHLYECVRNESAQDKMIEISITSPMLLILLEDVMKFLNKYQ